MGDLLQQFVFLWSVIDPIGTVPVFIAVTAKIRDPATVRRVAVKATVVAAAVLFFFVVTGEILLDALGIPLPAFQVAGGIVLFLFALTMIFGESKPEEELHLVEKEVEREDGKEAGKETPGAIFPLAIPSIASPGAMMAAVLLTDNNRFSLVHQGLTTAVILVVLLITLGFMLLAGRIQKLIGQDGASVVSRVMGLILTAVAANAVLEGIRLYFGLGSSG